MAALASSCLPGDRARRVWVVSRCPNPVWINASEVGHASAEDFVKGSSGTSVSPGERQLFPVFDNDGDGVTLSVSASPSELGKLTTIPHSGAEERTVEIEGPMCP